MEREAVITLKHRALRENDQALAELNARLAAVSARRRKPDSPWLKALAAASVGFAIISCGVMLRAAFPITWDAGTAVVIGRIGGCEALNGAGYDALPEGHPAYDARGDADQDGYSCERKPAPSPAPEHEPLALRRAPAVRPFSNCRAAMAAGYYDIPLGSPAYLDSQDGDGDGFACEPYPRP